MKKIESGIWSGIFATSAMTMGFLNFFTALSPSQKKPLPPAQLTSQITAGVGSENMTLISHFGYGIACGLIYSLLPKKVKAHPLQSGIAFGGAVWALSYFGLIPALKLQASGPKLSLQRNLLMLAAHVVYGSALGFSDQRLENYGSQVFDESR